jgi:hypothetical protein
MDEVEEQLQWSDHLQLLARDFVRERRLIVALREHLLAGQMARGNGSLGLLQIGRGPKPPEKE